MRDFNRIASKLLGWPEQLLVHHFKVGLDPTLHQECAYRGLSPWLGAWYLAVTKLYAELRECRPKGEVTMRPRRFPDRVMTVTWVGPPSRVPPPERPISTRTPILCFRCGQPGHHMAQCPVSSPKAKAGAPGTVKPKKSPWKNLEQSRGHCRL